MSKTSADPTEPVASSASSGDELQKRLREAGTSAALQHDHEEYKATGVAHYAWHAWLHARSDQLTVPEWVLEFIDAVATRELPKRTRAERTAERYRAALLQMKLAVAAHKDRVHIRDVGKTMNRDVNISRRDRPNITAIARQAAKANGVSVNRLLAMYRALPPD